MPDILHDFPIDASAEKVFDAVSSPEGLNSWWTKTCEGGAAQGAEYTLGFGPGYDWRAAVAQCVSGRDFELEMTRADSDWLGTLVGFALEPRESSTVVHFTHLGWPSANEHYRVSSFCWAMYLRLLKRYVETGEVVAYEKRLDA